jgi:hypothetical protein
MDDVRIDRLAHEWIGMVRAPLGPATENPRVWELEEIFKIEDEVSRMLKTSANTSWQFVDRVIQIDQSEFVLARLGAGPVEDLLGNFGGSVLPALEERFERSPAFRKVLASVWRNRIPHDVWTHNQRRLRTHKDKKRHTDDASA